MDEITINQAIEKYLRLISKARSANTHKTYQNALGAFKLALAAHNTDSAVAPVSKLKESVLATFLDYLKDYAPATEVLYTQAAVGFYQFLAAEEIKTFNMEKIKVMVKMRGRRPGVRLIQFPMDGIEKVLDHYRTAEPIPDPAERIRYMRDRAFILVLASTGMRVHEACKLHRGDIDWHEGKAVIIGKGDKQAVIHFTQAAMDALKDYLNSRKTLDGATMRPLASLPLFSRHDQGSGGSITEITTKTGREIIRDRVIAVLGEQQGITPHSFRHYFVTMVLRGTGNLKIAQGLARHSNIATTEKYVHISDDELDKAYNDVFESYRNLVSYVGQKEKIMEYVWKCRDCKTEFPEDKEDLPKYTNPSGIEGVICPCGGMLDLCPTQRAPDAGDSAENN